MMILGILAQQPMLMLGGGPSGYPEVRGSPVFVGSGATSVLSIDVPLPTNQAGDLMLVFQGTSGSVQIGTRPDGWNRLIPTGGSPSTTMYWRVSTGGETTVTCNNNTSRVIWCFAIVIKEGTFYASNLLDTNRAAGSGSPNPPELTTPWGVQKNLFLAFGDRVNSTTHSITSFPLPDNNISAFGTAVSGLCTQGVESATLDPAEFGVSTSGSWTSITLGIPPALTSRIQVPRMLRLIDETIASASSQVIPLPDDWAPGQLCVICTTNTTNTNDAASSGMTGWTQLSKYVGAGTTTTYEIWYRVLQSGDVSPTLISSGATTRGAVIMTFAAGTFDTTTPLIEAAANVSTTSTVTADVAASSASYSSGNYLLCMSLGNSGQSGNSRRVDAWPLTGNNLQVLTSRGAACCFAPFEGGNTPAATYVLSGLAGWAMVAFLVKGI